MIFESLYGYGLHDTTISKIEYDNKNHFIILTFNEGVYNLDETGKETTLTSLAKLKIIVDENTEVENCFFAMCLNRKKKKYPDIDEMISYLKKHALCVGNVFFSKFDNTILLTTGNDKDTINIELSCCQDIVYEIV